MNIFVMFIGRKGLSNKFVVFFFFIWGKRGGDRNEIDD